VWSLAYSRDGKHLATGSYDKTVRVWDLTYPLNSAPTKNIADLICQKVWRNMTLDEWHEFVGVEIRYERTCPNLPIHPSLFETAEKLAKGGDLAGATTLLERARQLDLDLDPKAEAARLAGSGDK
jgi:WD domain, G-beta repeat